MEKTNLLETTFKVPGLGVPVKVGDIVRNWLVASALGILTLIFQPSLQENSPFQLVYRLWVTNWAFWTFVWVLEAGFWRKGHGYRILPLPKGMASIAPAYKVFKVTLASVLVFGLALQILWPAQNDSNVSILLAAVLLVAFQVAGSVTGSHGEPVQRTGAGKIANVMVLLPVGLVDVLLATLVARMLLMSVILGKPADSAPSFLLLAFAVTLGYLMTRVAPGIGAQGTSK